jgi:hypothetical protein
LTKKCFHFQELDWIICFPSTGNEGRKYLYYSVTLKNPKKGNISQVCLEDLVDAAEFEQNYPHTVGFYKETTGNSANFCSNYLEIRVVRSIEEFWKFLNDLNI